MACYEAKWIFLFKRLYIIAVISVLSGIGADVIIVQQHDSGEKVEIECFVLEPEETIKCSEF